MKHLDTETILDAVEGRTNDLVSMRVRTHRERCADCTLESDDWEGMLAAMRQPALERAPASVLERAFGIFQPAPRPTRRLIDLVAELVTDSWGEPALAGLRGEIQTRQLFMRAADYDMHLRVVSADDSSDVHGQLLERGGVEFDAAFGVCLLDRSGRPIRRTSANEFGEFSFERVSGEAAAVVAELSRGVRITCDFVQTGRPTG